MASYGSTQAVEFLNSNEYQEEVETQATDARRKGVTGVPFTVINGRWAVSGGQSAEVYAQVRSYCFVSSIPRLLTISALDLPQACR